MKSRPKTGERRPRPRTGEKRQVRQPLAIDRLPQEVRDRIVALRAEGKGWEQIEGMSYGFAGRRLPHSSLHRWYDIRVEQELQAAMEERELAQRWVNAFAGKGVPQLSDAVRNALGESVFLLKQAADSKNGAAFQAALLELGHLLVKFDKLGLEEKKLALERQKLDAVRAKLEGLKKAVGGAKGAKQLRPEELRKKLDEIYGIAK